MDAPLILTTRIDPSEIDKEAHNVDINWQYPVEFYELTQSIPDAKEAITKGGIVTVAQVLGTPAEYTGFGYTHLTDDANEGPKNNPYNTLDSMREKTKAQFALGDLLVSVENTDQSSRLIDRHLLRDMRGNLASLWSTKGKMHQVRCVVSKTAVVRQLHERVRRKGESIYERERIDSLPRQRYSHCDKRSSNEV